MSKWGAKRAIICSPDEFSINGSFLLCHIQISSVSHFFQAAINFCKKAFS